VFEKMLDAAEGWCHVDDISTHLVGEVLKKDDRAYDYLTRWSSSDNFWIRRASLISPLILLRKGGGDLEFTFQLCEKMLAEREFFIKKAIGWVLREASKASPDEVCEFIKAHKEDMSVLTFREAVKRLPPDLRNGL